MSQPMQTCVRLLCQGDLQPYLHHHGGAAGSVEQGLRGPGHRPVHERLQESVRHPCGSDHSLIAVRRWYAIAGHACMLLRSLFTIVSAANMMEVLRMFACMVMSFPFLPQLFISVKHHCSSIYAWIGNGGTCTVNGGVSGRVFQWCKKKVLQH